MCVLFHLRWSMLLTFSFNLTQRSLNKKKHINNTRTTRIALQINSACVFLPWPHGGAAAPRARARPARHRAPNIHTLFLSISYKHTHTLLYKRHLPVHRLSHSYPPSHLSCARAVINARTHRGSAHQTRSSTRFGSDMIPARTRRWGSEMAPS